MSAVSPTESAGMTAGVASKTARSTVLVAASVACCGVLAIGSCACILAVRKADRIR